MSRIPNTGSTNTGMFFTCKSARLNPLRTVKNIGEYCQNFEHWRSIKNFVSLEDIRDTFLFSEKQGVYAFPEVLLHAFPEVLLQK
jgi:hypothetical protein